jgi:putative ABC transport system substrate-binding protein
LIPIVFISSGDPVQAGLAQSLSHPGLNATGFTLVFDDIAPRRLQLLKECAPAIRRVGFLWNPLHVDHEVENVKNAAKALGVEIVNLEVRGSNDVEPALQSAKKAGIDSLYVVTARVTIFFQRQILEFARDNKLPMASGLGAWAEKGALISYGPNLYQVATQTATDVNKVLMGAKPGDIPIAQPTNFKLSINLKTAKALNLTIPTSLVATADKVVEP